jgi:hypothetical protein
VDDEREITDKAMTVELLHIAGNPHADTLLMAYFPAALRRESAREHHEAQAEDRPHSAAPRHHRAIRGAGKRHQVRTRRNRGLVRSHRRS